MLNSDKNTDKTISKWKRRNRTFPVVVLLLIGLAVFLWIEGVGDYMKQLRWTEYSLRLARQNIISFREITGRNPISLSEINQYAKRNINSGLRQKPFGEHLSDVDGNRQEHNILNGQGGLFYDPESGVVKVNLTKPIKSYLRLYFGKKRNEIPSEW